MVLKPFPVADVTPKVAPRTPGPTGPLVNELVKRAMQAVRQQPGKPVVEPHERDGSELRRERYGFSGAAERLREPSEHREVGVKLNSRKAANAERCETVSVTREHWRLARPEKEVWERSLTVGV